MFKNNNDNEVFTTYKFQFEYFNYLIKKSAKCKETILKELNISYTSYLRGKTCNSKTIENIVRLLSSYFKISFLSTTDSIEYMPVVKDLFNDLIYCGSDTEKRLLEINGLILKNTYLTPIFKLLRLGLKVNIYPRYNEGINMLSEEFKEIEEYEGLFNGTTFEYIYLHLMNLLSNKKIHSNYYFDQDDETSLMILNYSCLVKSYFQKDYEKSVYYFKEVEPLLLSTTNIKRYLYSKIIYLSALNNLGYYKKAAIGCENIIKYLKFSENKGEIYKAAVIIFFTALLSSKRYTDVISMYRLYDNNDNSLIIFLLIAYKLNGDIDKYKSVELTLTNEISDRVMPGLSELIEFWKTDNSNDDIIRNSSLNDKLKDIILSFKAIR